MAMTCMFTLMIVVSICLNAKALEASPDINGWTLLSKIANKCKFAMKRIALRMQGDLISLLERKVTDDGVIKRGMRM